MSKEKQIEEMAKIVDEFFKSELGVNFNDNILAKIAGHLYDADCRKQSEVVKCKDCEHFYQDGNVKVCRHWNCHSTEENAYCSYGEAKGGGE